jgi:RHS repeat-associated protein
VYNSNGLAYYRHADWLGSSRFASLPSGTSRLYYDGAYAETGNVDRNFTGQNQDTVNSGAYPLYDFLYRQHHPVWGRWVSPDPAGLGAVDPTNPQSLNRYAYVLNNPMTLIDPLGLQDKSNIKLQAEPTTADCTLNGIYTSCSVVASVVNAGAAVECTSVNCGGLRPAQGPAGTTEWQRWVAPVTTIVPSSDPSADFLMKTEIGHWEVVGVTPDFVQYAFNVNPPTTFEGTLLGGTVTLTIDKYHNWYFGAGYNVGRGATIVSLSGTPGWVLGQPATPQTLNGLLTGGSWTSGGSTSFYTGGFTTTNASGTAVMAGPATPQYGFSYTVSTTVSNLWNWLGSLFGH